MSGNAGNRPWNGDFPLVVAQFPTLIFGNHYQRISTFLRDESRVREGLFSRGRKT